MRVSKIAKRHNKLRGKFSTDTKEFMLLYRLSAAWPELETSDIFFFEFLKCVSVNVCKKKKPVWP